MKHFVTLFFLAISCMVFAQQPCRFCDTMPPYKHSINIQVNRAFSSANDWGDFILDFHVLATGHLAWVAAGLTVGDVQSAT